MKLIGMLDSPFVRRVAISMRLMGLAYEHQPLSVFRDFESFRAVNPLVKAPTLVCDDGEILMDSSLILDYLDGLVAPEKRLLPPEGKARRDALLRVGVALGAFEKAVQVHYERDRRPTQARHQPWLDRVTGQAIGAFDWLEQIVAQETVWPSGARIMQDGLCIAIAWRFAEFVTPDLLDPLKYPALAAFSRRAEALPEFVATPLD